MQLTRVFLKRPTLVFVLITLTFLAAVMALRSLVVQETPNNGLPAITVTVAYSGASTSDLQTEVAEPIENQLAGTPYLDHIETTIESGQVQITASFGIQSTDTENIANVEQAVQQAEKQLPSTITPPTLRVANPSEPVVVTLALTSKKYDAGDLGAMANNSIVPVLEQIPGVSNVNVGGTTQPAFMVMVDPNMLAASNLTLTDVVNSISPNNLRAPGGIVYQPGRETQLDVRGDLPDPQSVANLPIHVAYTALSAVASGLTTSGGAATGSSAGGSSSGSSSTSAASSSGGTSGGGTSGGGTSGAGSTAANGASNAPGTSAGTIASAPSAPNVTITPPSNFQAGVPSSTIVAQNAGGSPAPVPSGNFATSTAGGGISTSTSSGATSTTTTGTSGTGTSGTGTRGTGTSGTGTTGTGTSATSGSTGITGGPGTSTVTTGAAAAPGGSTSSAFSTQSSTSNQSSGAVATTTSGGSSLGSPQGANTNFPIDAPSTIQTVTSNNAIQQPPAEGVAPSVGSSSFGSGSGTSLSPFVGAFQNWAVPTADKRISDVARVLDSTVIRRLYASDNGKPGVFLNIQKQASASEVTVSDDVLKALPALRKQFPDVDFAVAHVQSTYTEQQVASVEHTLIEGIVLTAIVMLFFLGSWRNAIVVMIAIPTSLGVTLFVMKLLNLTLDTVSLMAMTLVIGILIDDSTVVLENIERHRHEGEEPADAALHGRSEIGMAAIVITMVDVVVFLPIAFIGGQVGQYLEEFAIVITIATLTSLIVSFTITPTLAGIWSMKSTWKPWRPIRWFDERFETLRKNYSEKWLLMSFERPWWVIGIAAVTCILAILLVPTGLVGEEFIPAGDQGVIYTQITLPPGHPLSETQALMGRLEADVKQIVTPHDLQYETTISGAESAAFGGFVQQGNVGQISVYLNSNRKTSTNDYAKKLQQQLQKAAPNALVTVTAATQQGGGNQQEIDEEVTTLNGADPTPFAAKIFQALKETPGATGVQDSATNAAPQMEIEFNRPALQALDVSVGTAAQAVEAAYGGAVASQIETPTKGLTDIEVIYQQTAQTSLDGVMSIPIRSEAGSIVHLGDVAYFKYQPAPLVVTRENRAQVIHITANVGSGSNLSNVTKAFLNKVKALHLPSTVTIHPAAQGQQALMGQALRALGGSMILSIILVFLMIVALYNSYRTPFVTLFAIPLATVGALGALWITHQTLNLYSLIGIVLLVGLVTKNGILLVDYADTVRLRGKSKDEGIREAASIRFRPIVMTTIAMVAGMLPLAIGLEPGGQTRASLAIVVIGGLLSSLFLTLFIVPIMYRWIAPDRIKEEIKFSDDVKNAPAGAHAT